jgi:hypothetical protein
MQAIYSGGGAQAVEVYATDAQGRRVLPSGATAQIVDLTLSEDDAERVIVASAAATRDTTSTASTAAVGRGEADPRKIPLTSATGFVIGRHYQITAAGKTEAFELDRLDGVNAYARDELRGHFATGATVAGLRVTMDFPALVANDADELDRLAIFAADWVFTGVTGPARVRTLCRIERRGKAIRATADDLLLLDPQLAQSTHSRTVLESHLRHADRELDALLLRRGDQLANVDHGIAGNLAVSWRALALAYRVLGPTHEARALWAQGEAQRWISMVLDGHKPDDHVETSRSTDVVRTTRRRLGVGVI